MATPTPSAVIQKPVVQTAGARGSRRVSSQPHSPTRANNSQTPKNVGSACWSRSQGDSSFLARFMPNHSKSQTARSRVQSQLAHLEALSAVKPSQVMDQCSRQNLRSLYANAGHFVSLPRRTANFM